MIEITPDRFLKIGFIAFSIVSICNAAQLAIFWYTYNIFSIIASIANIFFNIALVGVFLFSLKQMSGGITEGKDFIDDKEIKEIVGELNNEQTNHKAI